MRAALFVLAAALATALGAQQQEDAADHDAEAERQERLRSLPYAAWTPAVAGDTRSGVTRFVRGRAWEGLNLYGLPNRGEARLVDMQGKLVQSWATELGQPDPAERLLPFFKGWQRVALSAGGSLFAAVNRNRLLKLDPASRVSWERGLQLHHDVFLAPDGSLHALTEKLRMVERSARRRLVFDNEIVSLDAGGAVQRRISLFDVLMSDTLVAAQLGARLDAAYARLEPSLRAFLERRSAGREPGASVARRLLEDPRWSELERVYAGELPPSEPDRVLLSRLHEVPGEPPDLLHTNALIVFDRRVPGLGEPGDILVSVRNLDLLAVVDPKLARLRWKWGPGQLERQHQPSVLPNGHLLVFDNRPTRQRSRVVEVKPGTGEIVWSYEGSGSEGFFSRYMGGCQGLPNGNVLIVESAAGRAFEVTRAGELVWEFLNPERAGDKRATIYRMERIEAGRARLLSR